MPYSTIPILGLYLQSLFCGYTAMSAPPEGCKRQAVFVQALGFNLSRAAFTTSEKRVTGLAFIEIAADGNASHNRIYQHPTWQMAGGLGPIAIDELGNVFVAPVPTINVLHNAPDLQNTLYKVNTHTGEMGVAVQLPLPTNLLPLTEQNPYGLLGLGYDCDTQVLYATSVARSTRNSERGCVFALRKNNMAILDTLNNIDAMGVGIGIENGEKRLYVGSTRTSVVYSVGVNADGSLRHNDKRLAVSLEGLGARGDDCARKIRFNEKGEMLVQGIEFYYNLIAPTEKQETLYIFQYSLPQKRWVFVRYG